MTTLELNMVELEWSVLSRQCLQRRIGEIAVLKRKLAVWQAERNERGATVE